MFENMEHAVKMHAPVRKIARERGRSAIITRVSGELCQELLEKGYDGP